MNRRSRRIVALVVLAMHAFAPMAAGANAVPGNGAGDICTAAASYKANARRSASGLPTQRSDDHRLSHCALCSGGAANDALISSSPAAATEPADPARTRPDADVRARAASRVRLPDARGPPSLA